MKKKKRLSGIERRWFVNNVGVIMLLVAACVLGVENVRPCLYVPLT